MGKFFHGIKLDFIGLIISHGVSFLHTEELSVYRSHYQGVSCVGRAVFEYLKQMNDTMDGRSDSQDTISFLVCKTQIHNHVLVLRYSYPTSFGQVPVLVIFVFLA